jgi:small-conductance mechanosensitive channel
MKVPNHILFSEKITNLAESGGTFFEINVTFQIAKENADEIYGDINIYIESVKEYALIERRSDWEVIIHSYFIYFPF